MPKNNISIFNCKLVEAVEKYPCLYDYNLKDYCNREVTNVVWEKIAADLHADAQECKNTWKNLRIVFTRYLRNIELDSSKKRKEYYLNTRMMFLCPFVRPKTSTLTAHNTTPSSSSTSSAVLPKYDSSAAWSKLDDTVTWSDDDKFVYQLSGDSSSETSIEVTPQLNDSGPHYQFDDVDGSTMEDVIPENMVKIENDYVSNGEDNESQPVGDPDSKKRKLNDSECQDNHRTPFPGNNYNYKRLYLFSLVPDIEQMNDNQFRKFRRKVDEAIDEIMDPDS